MSMKYDVFISYSRKDYQDSTGSVIPGSIVSHVRQLLDENGISYWFDEKGIYHGDKFATVIARNIKQSRILLFISTENSNSSKWTSMEIAVAHEYDCVIIPFRYDRSQYDESVVLYLAPLDRIDYLDESNPMETLIDAIKHHLAEIKAKEEAAAKAEQEKQKQEQLERQEAERLLNAQIDESKRKIAEQKRELERQQSELAELESRRRARTEEEVVASVPLDRGTDASVKRFTKEHPILVGCGSISIFLVLFFFVWIVVEVLNDETDLQDDISTQQSSVDSLERDTTCCDYEEIVVCD